MNLNDLNQEIWYHGTNGEFLEFSYGFIGGGHDQEGPGFYFTNSQEDALHYGKIVLKVKLGFRKMVSTKRPVNVRHVDWLMRNAPNLDDVLMDWDENPLVAFNKAFKIMIIGTAHQAFQNVWYDFYRNNSEQYLVNMVRLGYDGVVVGENSVKHAIVFNPSIVDVVEVMRVWG